ncbi:MAG TPA: response regulator transcription factor [Nitrospira sp.]|nr:response regulator transcription factor [Nitrospira sp.]
MTNTALPILTIAIISGQHIASLGLQKLLESRETHCIVVQKHQRLVQDLLLSEKPPDILILDMETERDTIGTIRRIRESASTSKIVLLGGFEENDRMREAFDYGVDGLILKIQPPQVVLAVIEALYPSTHHDIRLEQNRAVAIDLKKTTKHKAGLDLQPAMWPEALTEREREVIRLVGQGLSNKDIAYHLSISGSTVRHHLTNIFDKLGVSNRQNLLIQTHDYRSIPS